MESWRWHWFFSLPWADWVLNTDSGGWGCGGRRGKVGLGHSSVWARISYRRTLFYNLSFWDEFYVYTQGKPRRVSDNRP